MIFYLCSTTAAFLSYVIIFRPRWVFPVLTKVELEVLLEAAIDLSKKGEFVFYGIFHCECYYTYFHTVVDDFAFLGYKILHYSIYE